MKNFMLCLLSLLLAQASTAQTKIKKSSLGTITNAAPTASNSTVLKYSPENGSGIRNHLSVGGLFSTATDLTDANVVVEGSKEKIGTADFTSSAGFGLNLAYADDIDSRLALQTGVQLLTQKSLETITFKSTNGQKFSAALRNSPTYQPLIAYGNIAIKANDAVYFPLGLNYTLINFQQKGDFDSFEMRPQLGFQFGMGAKFQQKFALELTYQTVKYELDSKASKDIKIKGDVKLSGLTIAGRYLF